MAISQLNRLRQSPFHIRVIPFVVFLFLTALPSGSMGRLGPEAMFWMYFVKTVVGAWLIWLMRSTVLEMRWVISVEAVIAGILVFILWVGLDGHYPTLDRLFGSALSGKTPAVWNPFEYFDPGAAWFFVAARIVGSTLVVPPLEEVFYRSFLYRYVIQKDFLSIPLGAFHGVSFLVMSLVFGFAHREWLAGILCAAIFQGLVCWKKRLGDAMTAHAITNFLLGCWVVWKGAWHFW